MTPLEIFAIIVLGGAVLILLYYYLQENRNVNFDTFKSQAGQLGEKASNLGGKVYGGDGNMHGMGDKVSGMGERLKGKVKEVPISTDALSGKIDLFLNEKSDQLIEDWELATKTDVSQLESRFNKVAMDLNSLESRFKDYKKFTNDKLEEIESRLDKIEKPEEEEKSKI